MGRDRGAAQVSITVAEYRKLKKPRKYRNKPTMADGHKFDSVAEANRYSELKWLEKAGQIGELEVHPQFRLDVNGVHIGNYKGDFGYRTPAGYVLEDVKSAPTKTQAFKLRKRLMKAIHGIDIVEVT
jgi:uncharacterized protein DUF1064